MHTSLGLQISERILSVDLNRHRLDSCLIAVEIVENFSLEAHLVCPTTVHAVEHPTPVTGLGSTRTGIQAQDRIVAIILAGKQGLHAELLEVVLKLGKHLLNLRNHGCIILLISHLNHDLDILILLFQPMIKFYGVLEILGFLHELCRALCVIPESRLLHRFV